MKTGLLGTAGGRKPRGRAGSEMEGHNQRNHKQAIKKSEDPNKRLSSPEKRSTHQKVIQPACHCIINTGAVMDHPSSETRSFSWCYDDGGADGECSQSSRIPSQSAPQVSALVM